MSLPPLTFSPSPPDIAGFGGYQERVGRCDFDRLFDASQRDVVPECGRASWDCPSDTCNGVRIELSATAFILIPRGARRNDASEPGA